MIAPDDVLADFIAWADAAPWKHTKGETSGGPHAYVVRDRHIPREEFRHRVAQIRSYGAPGKFYRNLLVYWVIGPYRYWTMGASVAETTIINRAAADSVHGLQNAPDTTSLHTTPYDDLAPTYDSRYQDDRHLAEDATIGRHLLRLVHGVPLPRVLDVGAGTGLLLRLGAHEGLDKVTQPRAYLPLDPSQGMLNELLRRHSTVKRVLPCTVGEAFEHDMFGAERFDLIAALFGSASYLTPDEIAALPSLLAEGGRAVFMPYKPGYYPTYIYDSEPATAEPARQAIKELGGELKVMNDFWVVTI